MQNLDRSWINNFRNRSLHHIFKKFIRHLPGIYFGEEKTLFLFSIVTCIIVSVVLTLIINFFK